MATKKLARICLLLVWLALTLYLSLQPGTESGATSSWLAKRVADIFGISTVHFKEFHAWLRDAAHFGMHMVLAILAFRTLVLYVGTRRALLLTFICCGLIAVGDEVAQLGATGRVSELADVMLNVFGVETGMILGLLTTKES